MDNSKLDMEQFPRSSKYDTKWMFKNEMGPNSVWLMEFLTEKIEFKPGMRVLDLGCGMAMSSIFLANEYDIEVWAADLWIEPTDNYQRIKEFGVEDKVYPIKAEAHQLPFAEGFFDVIVSVDAYHYFGTDELYFLYINKYLKENGQFGIVVPGVKEDFQGDVPNELKEVWDNEFFSFHSSQWWRNHFEKTGLVDIEIADDLENSWSIWMKWEKALKESGLSKRNGDIEFLRADNGEFISFPRIVARKK
ncbi:MAG TPA: class I SAM-dependent methyltransferase [Halanaerobiales bacterium]|nr:class I SAM-dependent methyltransferase [Halanaerobiales bacterium]